MLFCFTLCHLERYFLKLKYFDSHFLFSYNNFVRMFLLSIFVHFEMSCISKAIDTKCLYGNWGEGLCYVTLSLTLKVSVPACQWSGLGFLHWIVHFTGVGAVDVPPDFFFLSFISTTFFLAFAFNPWLYLVSSISHVTLSREQCFSKTANFWPLSSNNILVNGPVNTSIIAFNQFLKLYSLCV